MSYALGIETLDQRAARVAVATPAQTDLARTLYSAGRDAFDHQSYEVALRYFTDAFSTLPKAVVLIAIGATMQRLGRFQDASYRYQRYLREYPSGPDRARAQTLLAEVQSAMEQQAAVASAPAPASLPPETGVPTAEVALVSKTPAQVAASAPEPALAPYDERATVGIWIVTGVGVASLFGWAWWMFRKG